MGEVATVEAGQRPAEHQPAVHIRDGMPDDLLEQVLCFLPPTQALRCSRTSRAYFRAALASLERATWPADPGTASCHANYCRVGHGGGYTSASSDLVVGTPCLDLRDAGDAVDSRALLAVLGRIFVTPGGSSNATAATSSAASADVDGEDERESRSPAVRKHAVLKGVALRSAAIQDEAIEVVLKLHGEGLEVLDLAGCGSLDASWTTTTIRQHCKRLVALDLSGPFGENWGGAGAPPAAGAFAGQRGPGYGLFQNHTQKLPLVCHLMPLMSTIGGDLLVLNLRDRPDISDEEVRVVAEGCSQLREFDVGTRSRTGGRFANITGQGLGYLYRARFARSLVYLGLRNQDAIGHLDLRALGSQLPSLRRLDLAGVVKVDDPVLKALASSTLSLSHVDISRARRVSAAGVSALARASPELECVSLHGITGVTDGAIRALCDACPKLRHVNVSVTRVTERGLRLLAAKDSLRWVNIRCCPFLSGNAPTRRVLAAMQYRLSMPKHPRDRGTVLGMERPQTQLRSRPPRHRSAAWTAAAAVSSAAADTSAAARRADALPLLAAGVGNLSLSQPLRQGGEQRLKAVGITLRDSGDPTQGQGQLRSRDGRYPRDDQDDRGQGGGEDAVENETEEMVPFDWDMIPRGSVASLGSWRGFRGLSGDVVEAVIQELHPYAQIEFRAESDSLLGPPTRKNNHGYLVHTSMWGQAWVEFEVDDQGCVL